MNTDVLNQISARSQEELAAMPLAELDRMFQQLALMKERTRLCEIALQSVMHRRYGEGAQKLRQHAGKSTGTVRLEEAGFVIISDLPKKVEYDQAKLKAAVEMLRSWGENPDDYIGIEIKVAETKYNAWPPAIRSLFEPARTFKTGKPSYRLEPMSAIAPSVSPSEVA